MNELQRRNAIDMASRIVPGMAAAKLRGDREGCLALLRSYQDEVRGIGLSFTDSWACLSAAALIWLENCIQTVADSEDRSPESVLQELGLRTMRAGT